MKFLPRASRARLDPDDLDSRSDGDDSSAMNVFHDRSLFAIVPPMEDRNSFDKSVSERSAVDSKCDLGKYLE